MILDACPSCSRPYDVSHLRVGTELRCLCDQVFAVRHREKGVTPVSCRRCGGAVGSDDTACPYCHAAIKEADRTSLVCPVCLARAPEGSRHCPTCAAALTPQALTPLPGDRDCPRCGGGLRIRHLGLTGVIECSECEGLWLSAEEFETICQAARERPSALLFTRTEKVPPEKLPPGSRAYVACLTCRELMFRRQVRWGEASTGVVVDACSKHGLWLDRDELEHVVRHLSRSQKGGTRAMGVSDLFRRPAPPPSKTPAIPAIPARQLRPDRNPVLDALAFLIEIFID